MIRIMNNELKNFCKVLGFQFHRSFSTSTALKEKALPPVQLDKMVKPKPALKTYPLFFREASKKLPPKLTTKERSVMIGQMWRDLGEEGKQRYTRQAEEMEAIYHKEMLHYDCQISPETHQEKAKQKALQTVKESIKTNKKREKAEKRQNGYPAFPLNSWALFMQEQNVNVNRTSILWKQLDPDAKQVYVDRAQKLRQAYDQQLHEWEQRMLQEGRFRLVRYKVRVRSLRDADDRPRRALTSFMRFFFEKRNTPEPKPLRKDVVELWRRMSDDAKAPYITATIKANEEYQREIAAWRLRQKQLGEDDKQMQIASPNESKDVVKKPKKT